ncbi:MAG: AMP-binding protein [Deltaproteobacteria bacterium]|nr:AMP-binding protein [Deltaproteobacteria bacterium]
MSFVWTPSPALVASANITRFMRAQGIATYDALIARSIADIGWFWDAALRDLGVEWFTPYRTVYDASRGFPWTSWFLGGEINLVHNCLDRHAASPAARQRPAILWEGDGGERRTFSYGELAAAVQRLAGGLCGLGLGRGDAVGIFMPMTPEVVIGMLACQKIGAIPIPVFSGFGAEALAVRMADAGVKAILTADGGVRRGKPVPVKATVDIAAAKIPSLQHVIVHRRTGAAVEWISARDRWWDAVPTGEEAETARLPAEATALVLYTSGTTGRPKGCIHTHAGALAQIAKEVGYAFDVKPGEVFFWLTDIGWMMGPWAIIGALFHGAAVVLYEGAPDFPAPDRLWRIVEHVRATHLGISPTVIRVLKRHGDEWVRHADRGSLRILGSTGEPWDPESYRWFFEVVGEKRCPIINISGGTELIGCLLSPLPITELKPCTLRGPGLGMDVDVFDESGRSIRGGIGYLVCKQPAPSMTKGFVNDRERYLETYFGKWPHVWNHGDWAMVDADGYWFLQGRADDTIKVAGKRVGPAEVEGALMEHPAVAEAAAIGVPHAVKGEVIVCFVVLKELVRGSRFEVRTSNEKNDDQRSTLVEELKDQVAKVLGKPMRPERIEFVSALPKTRSAKIVRGAIRKQWLGEPLGDISTIENPHALDDIPGRNLGR